MWGTSQPAREHATPVAPAPLYNGWVRSGEQRQRGSVLATATVLLAALTIIAGFTIVTIQRTTGVSGQQRAHAQALHAAEAGVEAAAAFLRANFVTGTQWTAYVALPDGTGIPAGVVPAGIAGNGVPPGGAGNPFDPAAQSWYEVTLHNNVGDPGVGIPADQDGVIIIRSLGHGPDDARVVLEVQVKGTMPLAPVTRQSWREIMQ